MLQRRKWRNPGSGRFTSAPHHPIAAEKEERLMLDMVRVVLFEPQYPENIGMAARACANMGVRDLVVVNPENFDMDKALPLATGSSGAVLRDAAVVETLEQALEGMAAAYGATARTGGWRQSVMTPQTCAGAVRRTNGLGGRAALVFGPEKAGLTNAQTKACTGLVHIPTSRDCTSLNLAQAVLLLSYECFKAALEGERRETIPETGQAGDRLVSVAERELLHCAMREALVDIDYIKEDNAEYWMLPLKRFLCRLPLRRGEFNQLMGICRQVRWACAARRGHAQGKDFQGH